MIDFEEIFSEARIVDKTEDNKLVKYNVSLEPGQLNDMKTLMLELAENVSKRVYSPFVHTNRTCKFQTANPWQSALKKYVVEIHQANKCIEAVETIEENNLPSEYQIQTNQFDFDLKLAIKGNVESETAPADVSNESNYLGQGVFKTRDERLLKANVEIIEISSDDEPDESNECVETPTPLFDLDTFCLNSSNMEYFNVISDVVFLEKKISESKRKSEELQHHSQNNSCECISIDSFTSIAIDPQDLDYLIKKFFIPKSNCRTRLERTPMYKRYPTLPLLVQDLVNVDISMEPYYTIFNGEIQFRKCVLHGRIVGCIHNNENFKKYTFEDSTATISLTFYQKNIKASRKHCLDKLLDAMEKSNLVGPLHRFVNSNMCRFNAKNLHPGTKIMVIGTPFIQFGELSLKCDSFVVEATKNRNLEIDFKNELLRYYKRMSETNWVVS